MPLLRTNHIIRAATWALSCEDKVSYCAILWPEGHWRWTTVGKLSVKRVRVGEPLIRTAYNYC